MVKNLPTNTGDAGSIPGSGRSSGVGNGNTFRYSCLGNPMDRGAWWVTVHGVAKESDTTLELNNNELLGKRQLSRNDMYLANIRS